MNHQGWKSPDRHQPGGAAACSGIPAFVMHPSVGLRLRLSANLPGLHHFENIIMMIAL